MFQDFFKWFVQGIKTGAAAQEDALRFQRQMQEQNNRIAMQEAARFHDQAAADAQAAARMCIDNAAQAALQAQAQASLLTQQMNQTNQINQMNSMPPASFGGPHMF